MCQRAAICIVLSLFFAPALVRSAGSQPPSLVSVDAAASTPPDLTIIRFVQDEFAAGPRTLLTWNSEVKPQGGPAGMDEPLSSDRPDFTEASNTVGRGVRQIEMGFTYFRDREAGVVTRNYSYPETLLRVGLFADWFELRMAGNYGQESVTVVPLRLTAAGLEDLYLGIKLGLTPQQGILPEMALLPQMTVPLGSTFTAGEVLPGMNWLYGWGVNDWLSLGGSTQANLAIDSLTRLNYTEFAQSLTIGYTLTENLGAYTEWFVLAPAGARCACTEHYFNGGFTYHVTNNLQLDIRAGVGASRASSDFFAGTGLVARF